MPPNTSLNPYRRLIFAFISVTNALPVDYRPRGVLMTLIGRSEEMHVTKHSAPLTESEFYIYLFTSAALVLLGGVFAGLTLGLMGQDEIYLKVMEASGTPTEKKCSKKVLDLISKGKHWLLVTLLLSNVITNETLPVILDRLLGGGFAAVFSSTVAIVIFGEIIPQSLCVRYGLELGAFFSPYVLALMYVMYPIAYPIAMLLDWILGQDHGTLYKKSGLKTLVNLHHTMGVERLNADEVTIISSVLDLKAKPVKEIMTPINKVFTLSSDQILDQKKVEDIFNAGYSRIPVHLPEEPHNFVGMLLVRILISYDPEDELPVSSFPLATLPETARDTSCLNILNYFQEGKSHMVVVSETPGEDTGAIGVVTLEDVIEELIGEEIVDESDVYIDENKTIKRSVPGPLAKRNVTTYLHDLYRNTRNSIDSTNTGNSKPSSAYIAKSTLSQNNSRSNSIVNRNHPKHPMANTECQINPKTAHGFKPSNLAIDPLVTANTHIKIKKQPQFPALAPKNETDTLLNSVENKLYVPNGEDLEPISPLPEVYDSEASAFVQGIVDNAIRQDQRPEPSVVSDSMESKKLKFKNNSYGIPLPKNGGSSSVSPLPQSQQSIVEDMSRSVVENNYISSRGVSKTIIETNYESAPILDESDTPTDVSLKSGRRPRKGSFWVV